MAEGFRTKGIKINCTKIDTDYNFNGHVQRAETTMKIEAQDIPQRDSF